MPTADVTISIATHNRCDDLLRTCRNLGKLDPPPREIIVCTDGCSDDSAAQIAKSFPSITLISNPNPKGSIASRDRILRAATSLLVLSLDDDSYPVDTDFLARIEARFDADPQLAVLTCFQITDEFPETINNPESQRGSLQIIASFANSAAAIRREVYLSAPGYPADFFHSYEEPDFALQCYSLGYRVVYDPDLTIRHHFSPVGRKEARTHRRHARNELWSTAIRAPLVLMPVLIPFRIISQLRYAISRGFSWAIAEPLWWLDALRGLPHCLRQRRKVSLGDYLHWLRLFRRPANYIPPTR